VPVKEARPMEFEQRRERYNQLLKWKSEINKSEIIRKRFPGWESKDGKTDYRPIRERLFELICADLRAVINYIKERYFDDWARGFPEEFVEWWEKFQAIPVKSKKDNFIKVPFWMVDDGHLEDLNGSEFLVLTIFARHAYFGDDVIERAGFEIRHGETFVGVETIARESGMGISSVERAISSLTAKDHLRIVTRKWDGKQNLVLRQISFMVETENEETHD
jgi:hypothetical protein